MRRLLLVMGVCLSACTEDYSVVLLHNSPNESECTANTGGSVFQGSGLLDVTSPLPDGTYNPGYTLTPVAQSGLYDTAQGTPTNAGNPMSHIAFVDGAEVEIMSDGTPASAAAISALSAAGLAKRTQRFSASIPPNDQAGLVFDVIDGVQVRALSGAIAPGDLVTVVTRSRLFGQIDDDDFKSRQFDYPITLCNGCLIKNYGSCDEYLVTHVFAEVGGSCGPLQDKTMSCCRDGMVIVCPAKGTALPMNP